MSGDPIRVLLIDDDEDYFVLTRALLGEIDAGRYLVKWAPQFDSALAALSGPEVDVALLDYDLGQHSGLELLNAARGAGCQIPIIILTGQGDHRIDLEAMQAGATDYVTKGRLDPIVLERSIRYAMERARILQTLTERESHIEELYRQEQDRSHELERAYADLRRAEAMRDELSHMIVHDLRGPLSAILGNLQVMSRVAKDAARAASLPPLLARAQTNTTVLVDMIDDLLKVSKMEAGALRPEVEPLRLQSLLSDKTPDYAMEAQLSDKTLSQNVPADLPAIQADPGLIGRVIDNLVLNALKYTPPGGHIEISAEPEAERLVVHVRDDGPGIAPEIRDRIFDKYFQASTPDSLHIRKGIGIGLTFCRLAVEAHGGCIWVDSAPGNGSVFSFALPRQQVGQRSVDQTTTPLG